MVVRFGKWGNSLALRLPATLARQLGAVDGSPVDLSIHDGQLVVRPVTPRPRYDLDALVAAINDENTHEDIATGAPVGHEYW